MPPFPLDETAARRFITYLAAQRVNPRTIQVYLSGLRAWHVTAGIDPPWILTPVNQLLLKSVNRQGPPPRRVQPFSPDDLYALINVLPCTYDNITYLSAMLIVFYGCMRASELCVHPLSNPKPATWAQFRVTEHPLMLQYRARSSKTAPNGFVATIGCTHQPLCPVCLFILYVQYRGPMGPLTPVFILSTGVPLTYNNLNTFIKRVTPLVGLDPTFYTTHSLRSGSATAAARAGCSDHQIKRLGRWASQAYTTYIRPEPTTDAAMAARLNNNLTIT